MLLWLSLRSGASIVSSSRVLSLWSLRVRIVLFLCLSGAVDFRQKLDAQRSAVLATEIKNNGFKLARWTAQALLSGADEMKIGYVTRTSARESKAHAVLGVQRYKAMDLAQQLNLEAGRMWGTLRRLSEAVLEMPDGKYLLIKEPNEVRVSQCALVLLRFATRVLSIPRVH